MNARETISELVVRYGETVDQKLELDVAGACAFRLGEQNDLGHFQFLEESEALVLWATVGFLPPDQLAPERAVRLLQMQNALEDTHGFTLGVEADTGRLVACGRRLVAELADSAQLAAWADALADCLKNVRTEMSENFPAELGDFDLTEVDLGDEGEDPEDDAEEEG